MELLAVAADLDLARPAFGAGDIHENPDPPADDPTRRLDMSYHLAPGRRVVMGAIDADRVHAPPGEVQGIGRIPHSLFGQSDEYAAGARARWRPENLMGIREKTGFTTEELPLGRELPALRRSGAGHPPERGGDRIQGWEDPALEPTQRGQPVEHEGTLQATDVTMPESPVIRQVQGAGGESGAVDRLAPCLEDGPAFGRDRVAQDFHLGAQLGQPKAVLAHLWRMYESHNAPRQHRLRAWHRHPGNGAKPAQDV